MNQNTRTGLLALVAVLLICGLPFFARMWFGSHETASRQPQQVASRTSAGEAVVSTGSPTPERQKSGAEEARRKRLQVESKKLKQANAALEEALQEAEADKNRMEKTEESMAKLNGKLLDPSLKVPQTASEAATLRGQNLAEAPKFKQKWGDTPPAAGTPEADEYAREYHALVTQSAALMKFMTNEKNATVLGQPGSVAQFQATALTGALGLRDDQMQEVNTTLDGYYQQMFTQGLNLDARPATGFDAWHQRRLVLSQQAYAGIAALLTPEQAAGLSRLLSYFGVVSVSDDLRRPPWRDCELLNRPCGLAWLPRPG